jgi:hypothetical protein
MKGILVLCVVTIVASYGLAMVIAPFMMSDYAESEITALNAHDLAQAKEIRVLALRVRNLESALAHQKSTCAISNLRPAKIYEPKSRLSYILSKKDWVCTLHGKKFEMGISPYEEPGEGKAPQFWVGSTRVCTMFERKGLL